MSLEANKVLKRKNISTRPELILRSALYSKGFRFKIHVTKLPGKPDIVLNKYNLVINVHGCFWHNHGCPNSSIPKTRQNYWLSVFDETKKRDFMNKKKLKDMGWRVHDVWECSLNKNFKKEFSFLERLLLAV